MKLGVAGLLGEGTTDRVQSVRALGFRSASWHLTRPELLLDPAALRAVRAALEGEGIDLCQLLPPQYSSLVHPEPAARREGIDLLRRTVDAAVVLGAGSVYIRPGSLNPAGPWTPHPENHRPGTRDRLVESLRALAPHAEAAGIPLAIEGHVVSPLHTPAAVREVIDRTGSPALRFNLDPVNFISCLDQAYDSGPLIWDLLDRLGEFTVAAHAKDVTVRDSLVVHIDECVPGEGYLDHAAFLRGFQRVCPRGTVLIEHLPAEKVPAARDALLRLAEAAGVPFEEVPR
jgi:sugar phosphate isomerase/epimerase